MKAAVCQRFGAPLVIEELRLAAPGPGQVRVDIAACAICHSDLLFIDGAWGGTLPVVCGHEAAGVVSAVGAGVERLRPGDHVVVTLVRSCGRCFYCCQDQAHLCDGAFAPHGAGPLSRADGSPVAQGLLTGAFAEQVLVDASQAVAIPDDIPLDSAALLACGVITGLGAVANTAALRPLSSAVVIGTGGVGLNSVQGAALCAAKTIIAVDTNDAKLDAARRFGATHALNPARPGADSLADAVRALTGGRGADYVFVTVGSARAVEQGVTLLRPGGTLVIVGMTPVNAPSSLETVDLASRGQRILGSRMGSVRLQIDVPSYLALYRQGRLKLDELISGRYALQHINDAIAASRRGDSLRNVIVF